MPGIFRSLGNGQYKDLNDNYDIRNGSNPGSTDINILPKVYISKGNGQYELIYPMLKEANGSNGTFQLASSTQCWLWQGGFYDGSIWGWAKEAPANNSAGQGFFGTGLYVWEQNIHKMTAGWFNFTYSGISSLGMTGIGRVKNVTKLTLIIKHKSNTGMSGYSRPLGIVATSVQNPSAGSGTASIYNPTLEQNRTRIYNSINTNATWGGNEYSFEYNDPELMNHVKNIMNNTGNYISLCSYSGKHPSANSQNEFYYDGTYYFSKDYFRFDNVKVKIDYTYEP